MARCFFLEPLFLPSPLLDDDDEVVDDDDDDDEEEEDELESESEDSNNNCAAAADSVDTGAGTVTGGGLGCVRRCSRNSSLHDTQTFICGPNFLKCVSLTYVKPPKPIEVKKFMANRVFRGSSRGKMPSKYVCRVLKIQMLI